MASPASVKGDPIPENNPVINLGELTHVEFANWFHDELLDIFKNKPNVEIDIANNTITVKIQKTPQVRNYQSSRVPLRWYMLLTVRNYRLTRLLTPMLASLTLIRLPMMSRSSLESTPSLSTNSRLLSHVWPR